MTARQATSGTLTRNQTLVLNCLRDAGRAITAYDLLDALRDHGLRAPVQVYRALEALGERELVHRIESLNAFVACCRHEPAAGHGSGAGFAICDDCGGVAEFALPAAEKSLGAAADRDGFETRHVMVELHGRCAHCAGRTGG
jgi:Fur family zinc uptake transcriptional regulator